MKEFLLLMGGAVLGSITTLSALIVCIAAKDRKDDHES